MKNNKYCFGKTLLFISIILSLYGCSSNTEGQETTLLVENNQVQKSDSQNNLEITPENTKNISINDLQTLQELSKITENVTIEDLINGYHEAKLQESIIKAMNTPGEARPWYEYRKIFITDKRIKEGVNFYNQNKETLEKVAQIYQVRPELIVAIIGVETFYGKFMGNYKVLDALYTLGFHYPKRAAYFSKEFANFISLAKKQQWNYDDIKGSYAGAMGMGQFMPWSYIRWAQDFDNDGLIDLFHNKNDAIASVANYFKEHSYDNSDNLVVTKVKVSNTELANKQITIGLELEKTVDTLKKNGILFEIDVPKDKRCRLFRLETAKNEFTYYVGFQNFYAITTYNRSPLYAMVVNELSQTIKYNIEHPRTDNKKESSIHKKKKKMKNKK
ncbi:MAG: lytic murein transglycosylase B [Succinivibrionaceae bacterium]